MNGSVEQSSRRAGARDHGVAAANADFVALGDHYILGAGPVEFEIMRLRSTPWGERTGELVVRCKIAGAKVFDSQGTVFRGELSLLKVRSRQDVAKALERQSRCSTIDFFGLLSAFCGRVLSADRTGEQAVLLRDVAPASADDVHVVEGFRLPRRHAAVIAGAEGCAKSMVALHIAGTLAARGVPTLYADWELEGADHAARLAAMFAAPLPPVVYVRCRGRIVDESDRLADVINDRHIEYLIVDSISWAADDLLDSAAAQAYYAVLRRLGIGSLSIAHKAKHDDEHKWIYGSTFWMAGARAVWMVQRSGEAPSGVVELGCYPRKNTFGPLGDTIGLRLTFEPGRVHIAPFDAASAPDLARGVHLLQRVRSTLASGARTRSELATHLEGVKDETLRRTVNRAIKRGLLIKFPSAEGEERIGLAPRVES